MLHLLQLLQTNALSQTARRRARGCLKQRGSEISYSHPWLLIPLALTILLALSGCDNSQREHQATIDQLKSMEGHKLHDFPTLTHTVARVMQAPLKSGNVEYHRSTYSSKCFEIFEVNPQTDVIVKARLSDKCPAP